MNCPLCHRDFEPKQQSHIVSKFIYNWIKDTSATGRLRSGSNINLPVQDGIKEHFLCEVCEELIGTFEVQFAREVFQPITGSQEIEIHYSNSTLKFAVASVWRALAYAEYKGQFSKADCDLKMKLESAKDQWSKFIKGEEDSIGDYMIHFLRSRTIEKKWSLDLPNESVRYLQRTAGFSVSTSENQVFVYVKAAPMMFLGIIDYPDFKSCESTEIKSSGVLKNESLNLPTSFIVYLASKIRKLDSQHSNISEKQCIKIKQRMNNDLVRMNESETFSAKKADEKIK